MIDTEVRLADWLPSLRSAPWVAIDTEADSLHAYPEKLCLIQIGIDAGNFLVDPLAGLNLSPLLEVLRDRELILHGGDYDLRMLRKDLDFVPSSIFDTMLGARLLGIREFGLTHLVSKYLGIQLEKGPQKANWARRPLTSRMEEYAMNDTAHLKALSGLIRQELESRGRLEWHREMCARLIADHSYVPPPDPDTVWRIKGSRHLPPRALAILREVWHWREQEAIAANRPPYFILSPEVMTTLAVAAMDPSRALADLLPRHLTQRRQRLLLEAVEKGRAAQSAPAILRVRGTPPTDASKKRFAELERKRDARARELAIDPTIIASKATLIGLSIHWEKTLPEVMNWQRSLLE